MGVRSSLMAAIYNKSLHLSTSERENRSTGEIVNIMAVDIQTIVTMVLQMTIIWSTPIRFIMCLISLNKIVGSSMWFSLVIIILNIPLNNFATRIIKVYRKRQMSFKDQRTRLTTEIMTNVKSLKLYGWEKALLDRLFHVRNNLQLKNLKQLIMVRCVFDFIWTSIPVLITGSTFALFGYLNNVPLTSDIVFPCISLFEVLTGPISDIPQLLATLIDTGVSLARLRDFLVAEEIQDDAVVRFPPANIVGEQSVEIRSGTFFLNKTNANSVVLKDINFVARKGELSCIVGKVGSGKSSFLNAILGDLYKSEGNVIVKGSVALVSQSPWLMNATVKENILFGNKFDPEFYQKIIEACSLTPDLKILPDGDDTEIGERGVSLSGGAKG